MWRPERKRPRTRRPERKRPGTRRPERKLTKIETWMKTQSKQMLLEMRRQPGFEKRQMWFVLQIPDLSIRYQQGPCYHAYEAG